MVDDGRRLDADALLQRVTERHASLTSGAGEPGLELYHRATLTCRATLARDGRSIECRRGVDEGSALRATRRDDGEPAFSAVTGSGEATLGRALERALGQSSAPQPRPLWPRAGREPRIDRDPGASLPEGDEPVGWLRRALDSLPTAPLPLDAWVEIAHTVESWATDGGFQASRVRARAFAGLRPAETGGPLLIGARDLSRLAETGWQSLLADRWSAPGSPVPAPSRPLPLLLNPESSAFLVHSLVRTLHRGEPEALAVGPGWCVTDNPVGRTALWGGSFDDAGFRTRSTRLADGKTICGAVEGAGHYRRPSFRDRPVPLPTALVVDAEGADAPESCLLGTELALQVIEPERWLLKIGGAVVEGGRPGPDLRPGFLAISPRQLARRCLAAVGPARRSYLGVETPALLFDTVTLQSA
jgi:hypothetical protein